MLSRLESVPYEVLARITLDLACADDALGPPAHLPAFFAASRTLASFSSDAILARIFRAKFDTTAARRRFGPIALFNRNLAQQLKIYCVALKRIRGGDLYSPTGNGDETVQAQGLCYEAIMDAFGKVLVGEKYSHFHDTQDRAYFTSSQYTSINWTAQDAAVDGLEQMFRNVTLSMMSSSALV